MRVIWMLTALIGCCLAGCTEVFEVDTAGTDSSAASPPQAQASPSGPAGSDGIGESIASKIQGGATGDSASGPQKPPTTPPPDSGTGEQRVKAQAGVAAAGRNLDRENGVARVVVEPVRTLFAFKENAVFKFQIPQAMQFFKASEGRFPRTHEEFMAKIVKANNLHLPELPPGQRYVYDPDQGELMVAIPKQ